MDSAVLFSSQIQANQYIVQLNSAHPAYSFIADLAADCDLKDMGIEEVTARCDQLREGLQLLIAGWIEQEHHLSGTRKRRAEEVRDAWGRTIRHLVDERTR